MEAVLKGGVTAEGTGEMVVAIHMVWDLSMRCIISKAQFTVAAHRSKGQGFAVQGLGYDHQL
jgi:hypothetical protein